MASEKERLKDFQRIPGVGKSIAQDFIDLEVRDVAELKDWDPEKLYENLCAFKGCHVDRCMLYVFRCAVYFASEPNPEQKRLKWWNWKD